MMHANRLNQPGGRRSAFSLIEVLIAIVVLALGLLGIAAVFPAVVTQQRATTDAVQGGMLSKSVEALLKAHYGANRQSQQDKTGTFAGTVQRANLKGWMSLVGMPTWSVPDPVRMSRGNYNGNWDLPRVGAAAPGIRLNDTNGNYIVMGTTANVTLPAPGRGGAGLPGYDMPGFLVNADHRKIGEEYIFDFAARRLGGGRPFATSTVDPLMEYRTCQDDMIQLAVFLRRVDRKNSIPAIGVDATGRPTFNGTGTYSPISVALYTVPDMTSNPEPVDPGTMVVKLNSTQLNYLRQPGQKFVTQWGTVHTVASLRTTADEVAIKPALDLTRAQLYPQLEFLYTPQIPVAVHMVEIEPEIY